jgi:hypothetical protein
MVSALTGVQRRATRLMPALSPKNQADAAMDISKASGAPTIAPGHVADVLGKYAPPASLIAATQAPNIQGYRDRPCHSKSTSRRS